jgi:hypothetical protein
MMRAVRLVTFFVLTISFAYTAVAQSAGSLTGAVTDPASATVRGAELVLTNSGTGAKLTSVSNGEGIFTFPSLQPGKYDLQVSAQSFAARVMKDITIDVGRATHLDVTLATGNVQQEVVVTSTTETLDSENGYKGQMITSSQVENLPLQSRNPQALSALAPGVVANGNGGSTTNRQGADGTGISAAYTINGGVRTTLSGYNEYVVDGISIINRRDGTVGALPSAGAIDQFQVQSGGISPDLGYTSGGVLNYVTKGGTNGYHGMLFEDYRGTTTNARPALPVNSPKNPQNWNQFGGNFGGPVWIPKLYNGRNRTFFFVDYDGSRWVRKTPSTVSVPTALMRQGNFSEVTTTIYNPASNSNPALRTAFPNNTINTPLNPIGQKILSLVPLPNLPGVANNYSGFQRTFTPDDDFTMRFDQVLGTRHRINFRWTRVRSGSIAFFPLGENDQQTQNVNFPSRAYTGQYLFSISPSLVYSLVGGYFHYSREFLDTSGNTVGGSYFGYTVSPAPESGSLQNVRPIATFDIYRGVGTSAPQKQRTQTYQLNQVLSWSKGRHFFRFGSDLRRYNTYGLVSAGTPNGTFTFSALQTSNGTATSGNSAASLLLGLPNTELFQQEPELGTTVYANAFYVGDDWKLRPDLTLNIGLRYDYETPIKERQNKIGWFDPTATNSVVGIPGKLQYAGMNGNADTFTSGSYENLEPRIGFAYSPVYLRGKTVIRGAYAIYSEPLPTAGFFTPAPGFDSTLNPIKANSTATAGTLANSYTLPAVSGPQGDAAGLGTAITDAQARHLKNPRVLSWNFGVQQELTKGTKFELLYSGNRGQYLLSSENANLPNQSVVQQAINNEAAAGGTAGVAQTYLNQAVTNPLAGKVPGSLGAATVTRANASAPFPQFSSITVPKNDRDSSYHSLQTVLQHRSNNGLSTLIAYTWSKLLTDATEMNFNSGDQSNNGSWQNPYSLRDARGPATSDHTHVFSGAVVYPLPFGKNRQFLTHGVAGALVGGFQLTGIATFQSGVPLAVTQTAANGLGLGAYRPDKVANPIGSHAGNSNGSRQWINPAAYTVVDGRFGTAPIRDSKLRGPNYTDFDLGVQRNFHIFEALNAQFRVEAFNAFNHPNLALPTPDRSSAAFGQINTVYAPRAVQLDLQLSF